jgi:putative ABC transport system ATP-binding protein
MLRATDLALDYASGSGVVHAVDTVSLEVPRDSFVGLIGPSGSGKSSLMYLLSGLKRPTRGHVVFDGHDYGDLSTAGLMRLRRERYGFVFQQHFLINYLTATENVVVGAVERNGQAAAYAQDLLGRVGLGDKLRKRPYELSIGERQRVAVARALVHRPAIVFADEPTASLDQATGHEVINLLAGYRREEGGSVVVVTHDSEMLTGADHVVQMRDGKLAPPSG